MSLIEQAARRLEELRRAGVELPDTPPGDSGRPHGELPTPEAMIAALEERTADVALPLVAHRNASPMSRAREEREEQPRTPGRHLDINLPRLKSLGFVTPDAPTSRIADEFRVVKRPIIRNAIGK